MALKTLFQNIAKLGISKKIINSSIAGLSVAELNFSEIKDYPLLFTTTNGAHRIGKNITTYSVSIYYIDRLMENRDNDMDVISYSMDILKHFVDSLRELDGVVDVSEDYDIINFTSNPMADAVVGSYVNIKIEVLNGSMCDTMMIEFINQIKKLTVRENGKYILTKDEGYNALERVEVEVDIDTESYFNSGYTEGYNIGVATSYDTGKEDGINEQKSKLTSISITENGTYTREDGYNEITVEVSDLNGDYNEGYANGTQDGYNNGYAIGEEIGYNNGVAVGREDGLNEGYRNGYDDGVAEGTANAGGIIAETARVLNITENGIYTSQYSQYDDYSKPEVITGVFDDGKGFYNYASYKYHYRTNVIPTLNTRLEFWIKDTKPTEFNNSVFVGIDDIGNNDFYFGKNYTQQKYIAKIGNSSIFIDQTEEWMHIIMSVEDGLWINNNKIGDFNVTASLSTIISLEIGLRGSGSAPLYGMIKINDETIIPNEFGLFNITTGEYLSKPINSDYEYIFTENFTEPIADGNLIRTINVNVTPKINIVQNGIKFGYATFSEVPNSFDFSGIKDLREMFYNCTNLTHIPEINTENVTNMYRMCYGTKIKTIPLLNTSNVKDISQCFYSCRNLETIPAIDTTNVTSMGSLFAACTNLTTVPPLRADSISGNLGLFGYDTLNNLINFGGLINIKANMSDNYSFNRCPNLSYESCINILNGLWDFRGEGDTTTTRTLKVHQNFLDLVGDEISIATNKGWQISV